MLGKSVIGLAWSDLPRNSMISTKPHIHPDANTWMEKARRATGRFCDFATSSVGEYDVTKKHLYIGTPLHQDFEQVAYQDSLVCQGPLGTREPIILPHSNSFSNTHLWLGWPWSFVIATWFDASQYESAKLVQSAIYLLACVALLQTPISGATAILNATRRSEDGTCGLNALLTYV